MLKKIKIHEACCGSCASAESLTPGVVENCKILGLQSRNGRRYLTEALIKAAPLYEGKPVFIDHPGKSDEARPFLTRFGSFKNIRPTSDGLYGDLHYNPRHIYAATFEGWLESDPAGVGFSHSATGSVREQDGELVVVEIVEVESVDLVAVPATTKGLFEATNTMDDTPVLDMPPDDEAPLDVDGVDDAAGHMDHIADAVTAIFKDESLSPEDKKKKILHLLKMLDEPASDEVPVDDEPVEEECDDDKDADDSEDKKKYEALLKVHKKLKAKLEAYEIAEARKQSESDCRKLCEKHSLPPALLTDTFLEVLVEAKPDARQSLIKDRMVILNASKKPISKPPVKDSGKLTIDDLLAD